MQKFSFISMISMIFFAFSSGCRGEGKQQTFQKSGPSYWRFSIRYVLLLFDHFIKKRRITMCNHTKGIKRLQVLRLKQKGLGIYGLIIIGLILVLIGKADAFSVDFGDTCSGLSVGYFHTCYLKSDGNVDCYGNNSYGQADNYTGEDAVGVSAGPYHTCIPKSDGNVDCYGNNWYGQADNYTGEDAVGVSAGLYHTCIPKSDGNVDCYGNNSYGQADNYTGQDAVGVSAGQHHTCVLKTDGNVDCYGNNRYGQADNYTGGDAVCTSSRYPDSDGDGYDSSVDCDDNNPSINPGSDEVCDGLDNDCDGTIDQGFDVDGDSVADCFDNCPETFNIDQTDFDDDSLGDACDICPDVPENDYDADGVCGDADICDGTMIPEETVPSVELGVNRFALVDGDDIFDTVRPGSKGKGKGKANGPGKSFTLQDTEGCSCEQILATSPDGQKGHIKYGCSISIIEEWISGK